MIAINFFNLRKQKLFVNKIISLTSVSYCFLLLFSFPFSSVAFGAYGSKPIIDTSAITFLTVPLPFITPSAWQECPTNTTSACSFSMAFFAIRFKFDYRNSYTMRIDPFITFSHCEAKPVTSLRISCCGCCQQFIDCVSAGHLNKYRMSLNFQFLYLYLLNYILGLVLFI